MPTPGEKKALLFLSLVAVLGSAARLVSANQVPVPTAAEVSALEAQIRVVDSVRRRAGESGEGRGRRRSRAKRSEDTLRRVETSRALAFPPLSPPPSLLDIDRASAAQLESLPGIGPALARRIVAARDSGGPFGSLEDMDLRVRGVGPALVRRLAPAVTFSGPRRPSSAERTEPFGNGGATAQAKRRRGR